MWGPKIWGQVSLKYVVDVQIQCSGPLLATGVTDSHKKIFTMKPIFTKYSRYFCDHLFFHLSVKQNMDKSVDPVKNM